MLSIMTCTAGNTEAECTEYAEHVLNQLMYEHKVLATQQDYLFLLFFIVGIILGFMAAYYIFQFYSSK